MLSLKIFFEQTQSLYEAICPLLFIIILFCIVSQSYIMQKQMWMVLFSRAVYRSIHRDINLNEISGTKYQEPASENWVGEQKRMK